MTNDTQKQQIHDYKQLYRLNPVFNFTKIINQATFTLKKFNLFTITPALFKR